MYSPAIAEQAIGNAVAEPAETSSKAVHIALFVLSTAMLIFCVTAAPSGALHAAIPSIETILLLTPPLLIPAAFMHEKKAWARRDAFLMLPWTLAIALLVAQVAPTTATFAYPLRDGLWRSLDEHLGISIPAIMALAARHPAIKSFLFYIYAFALHPLILCAIFVPILLGRREVAQRFVLTNAFSFVLALPVMLFLPAVGPWVGWHFAPDKAQQSCEATILALRHGSLFVKDDFGGIVCLPSFHCFWAIISACALYSFRYLRYPAMLVAVLICFSTMTTGWHYGVDVIAGLVMAAVCTWFADVLPYGKFSRLLPRRPKYRQSVAPERSVFTRPNSNL